MQTALLPDAAKVFTADLARVDQAQRRIGSLPTVGLLLLGVAVVAIAAGSAVLFRRTNRQFNVGLVIAAVVVLVTIGWIVVAARFAAGDIERSRIEGTAKFEQLAEARILAQKARTDETLQLITRGDISASEQAFNGYIDDLVSRLGTGSPEATTAVEDWTAGHRRQVDAYRAGDYPGAVAQALGGERGGSAAQFAVVESSLRDDIEAARSTLRDGVSDAGALSRVDADGDARADDGRRIGRGHRAVAPAQGVPVRTRRGDGVARRGAGGGGMWRVGDAATVGIAGARPCETGWCTGDHDDAAGGRSRLRRGGQPAPRPTCRHRVRCRRVRRWRPSQSADG